MEDAVEDANVVTTEKRAAILRATLGLVAERGFRGTTMALIVRRSGTSAGTIYHYFASKDEIIHALYQQIKHEMGKTIVADAPPQLAHPEHFQQIWQNAFSYYVAHPRETSFLEQYENSPYMHEMRAEALENLDEQWAAIVTLLQSAIDRGHIIDLPLPVLYELTLGVAVSLAKRQISGTIVLSEAQRAQVAAACYTAVARR